MKLFLKRLDILCIATHCVQPLQKQFHKQMFYIHLVSILRRLSLGTVCFDNLYSPHKWYHNNKK